MLLALLPWAICPLRSFGICSRTLKQTVAATRPNAAEFAHSNWQRSPELPLRGEGSWGGSNQPTNPSKKQGRQVSIRNDATGT